MANAYFKTLYLKRKSFFSSAIIVLITVGSLTSCSVSRKSYYFETLKKDTTIDGLLNKELESKILPGDNLGINFSSLNKDEDMFFNSGIAVSATTGVTGAGFLVDQEGNIRVHKLGLVKAAGSTRKELAAYLQKGLEPFLKDPIVTVQYLNHKITVMGEVERPQVINMAEEHLSVIDAIVISGDVKSTAMRNNVMIIREDGNKKNIKILNLENHSVFSSPWYYLQPNDIVYVAADEDRRLREEKRSRVQTNLAIIVSTVSLLIIVLNRVFP